MTTSPTRRATAALAWFPSSPVTEREVLDMTPAKLVALWVRLRHHYWLTDCRPMTEQTVDLITRKMGLIDAGDSVEGSEVRSLLTQHYGFAHGPDGWTIPELVEHRDVALASVQAAAERGRKAGEASGRARGRKAADAARPTPEGGADPTDF